MRCDEGNWLSDIIRTKGFNNKFDEKFDYTNKKRKRYKQKNYFVITGL